MGRGLTLTFLARFTNGPVMRALRQSLKDSEQDAVAYIAQLHQTGPGLYTVGRDDASRTSQRGVRVLPDRAVVPVSSCDVHRGEPAASGGRA